MRVSLELRRLPVLLPIPHLYREVVRGADDVRQRWVHRQVSDEVRVRLEGSHLLHSVIVEDSDEEVIRADSDPLLAGDKLGGTDRSRGHLEGLNGGLRGGEIHSTAYLGVEVVDVCIAAVQTYQHPRQIRMNVHRLHSHASNDELLFDFKLQWLQDRSDRDGAYHFLWDN